MVINGSKIATYKFMETFNKEKSTEIVKIHTDGTAEVFLHEPEHIVTLAILANDLNQQLTEAKEQIKFLEQKVSELVEAARPVR